MKTVLRGARFGDLTVIAPAALHCWPSGQTCRYYRVRCSRGHESEHAIYRLRSGGAKCRWCAAAKTARAASVRLPSGTTIKELAERTGFLVDTVYHRWIRGWSEERLAAPVQQHKRRAC